MRACMTVTPAARPLATTSINRVGEMLFDCTMSLTLLNASWRRKVVLILDQVGELD
jgi:hypothetical protein